MKQQKYLNGILTVIASCFVLITLAITGILSKAYAGDNLNPNSKKSISIPLNPDGSINVKILNNVMDVNVEEIGGHSTYGKVPVNIEEVDGYSTNGKIDVNVRN